MNKQKFAFSLSWREKVDFKSTKNYSYETKKDYLRVYCSHAAVSDSSLFFLGDILAKFLEPESKSQRFLMSFYVCRSIHSFVLCRFVNTYAATPSS